MSFDAERARLGRAPVMLCELALDYCANLYGETPQPSLITNRQKFDLSSWIKTGLTVTADTDASPEGDITADTLTDDDAAVYESAHQAASAFVVLAIHSASVFIKKDSIGRATRFPMLRLRFAGSTEEFNDISLDTSTGEFSISAASTVSDYGVQSVGDYWRVFISATSLDASNSVCEIYIYPAIGASETWVYTVGATGSIVAWGAELMRGAVRGYKTQTCNASGAPQFKCYNTRATCFDVDNYNSVVPKFFRFSNVLVPGQNFIPCITAADLAPTVITPDKGLGIRASIKVTLEDFSRHDRGFDPYFSGRESDAENQGTYLGRLLARNTHYVGRTLKIKTGYLSPSGFFETDFQSRAYVIESISGPDGAGKVTITAKDVLKLADDDRALAPAATTGKLVSDITDTDTSLTVTSGTEGEYTAEGDYIRIGDEIIQAPIANRSSNVFSNLTRGAFNTEAAAHSTDDSLQSCKHLNATNVIDLVEDLLINYASIPAQYINSTDWAAEETNWYSTSTITTLISEPTGVNELINKLAEEYFFQVWWNEIEQEIKLMAIVPPSTAAAIPTWTDESNLIEGKTSIDRNDDDRLTRVLFYYNPRTPLDHSDPEDFESVYVIIDADAEGLDKYADERVKIIYGRFVATESLAVQTSGRLLNRFKNTPKTATVQVDAKDASIWTGDIAVIESARLQGFDGAAAGTRFQVQSVKEKTDKALSGSVYEYKLLEINFGSRYAYIGPDTLNDYDVESDANKEAYAFIAPDSGVFDDGEPAYKII